MLNNNRKFDYQIFLSFSFSNTAIDQHDLYVKILTSDVIAILAVIT